MTVALSPFQKEKLEYYFNFFDADGNNHLEIDDLKGFMQKVIKFTGWPEDSAMAKECYEVHECFFSTLMERAKKHGKEWITLDMWMNMWARMLPGCTAMINFPIWLRLLPRSLFRILDTDHDGVIREKELANFYVRFVGISKESADSLAKYAMEQMTDADKPWLSAFTGDNPLTTACGLSSCTGGQTMHGKYPLNMDSYNQIFANFLLGKTPYGPGRFIFGCFEHMVERTGFTLIQGPPENLPITPDIQKIRIHECSPATPNSLVKVKFFRAA